MLYEDFELNKSVKTQASCIVCREFKKVCIICGTEFIAQGPNTLYCSGECRVESARRKCRPRGHNNKYEISEQMRRALFSMTEEERKAFQIWQNEYCNRYCYTVHYSRHLGETYHCERCGKPFVLIGSRQHYCKECSAIVRLENKLNRLKSITEKSITN